MGDEHTADFFDDEYVEVLLADGTVRKFSKEELIMNQDEQLKGIYSLNLSLRLFISTRLFLTMRE